MSIKTDAYENAVINLMRDIDLAAWTPYAALLTAAPDAEAGTLTEIAGTGYARHAVTLAAPANGATSNSAAVDFGTAGSNWGTATHVALYDAAIGGEAKYVIPLAQAKLISTNDPVSFAIGALQIAEQ